MQSSLVVVLAGKVLAGIGTFFAQAVGIGFVSRAVTRDRAAASGLYLASHYLGGLAGAALLGQIYDQYGWIDCVSGVGLSIAIATAMALQLELEG